MEENNTIMDSQIGPNEDTQNFEFSTAKPLKKIRKTKKQPMYQEKTNRTA